GWLSDMHHPLVGGCECDKKNWIELVLNQCLSEEMHARVRLLHNRGQPKSNESFEFVRSRLGERTTWCLARPRRARRHLPYRYGILRRVRLTSRRRLRRRSVEQIRRQ